MICVFSDNFKRHDANQPKLSLSRWASISSIRMNLDPIAVLIAIKSARLAKEASPEDRDSVP